MGGRSEDRSGAEACIEQILRDPGLRVPGAGQPADVLSLQELQRCSRQVKQGDCHHCARGAGACRNDHAGWVASELARHGYDGAIHEHGMTNTVGLFWRRDVFELPRRRSDDGGRGEGTVFFCDFDRPWAGGGHKRGAKATKKGAVLALLRHRRSNHDLLVVGAHPSVPLNGEGEPSPEVPLAEVKQLKGKIDNVYEWNEDKGDFHWLIAGDLNTVPHPTPGCAEPLVYRFLTGKACQLRSVYRTVLGHEPPLTSVKPDFRHTIDYLLTSHNLAARGVLDVHLGEGGVDEREVPWPSDHLPLLADIALLPYAT